MIQIYIYGGLGNQLFQYATARSLSILNNTDTYLCLDWFEQDFSLTGTTPRNFDLLNFNISYKDTHSLFPRIYSKLYAPLFYNEVSPFEYDENLLNLRKKNIWLNGYWANFKYFNQIKNVLLKELVPIAIDSQNQKILTLIQNTNSVSVHIRRGDFVKSDLFLTLDDSYYKTSIDYVRKKVDNPTFYIFSDDIEYCKTKFQGNQFYFVDVNINSNNYLDLYLMSKCQHCIMANSTFSWWGAYLNENENKIVIAPKQYYKDDKSSFETVQDRNSLNCNIPISWILM